MHQYSLQEYTYLISKNQYFRYSYFLRSTLKNRVSQHMMDTYFLNEDDDSFLIQHSSSNNHNDLYNVSIERDASHREINLIPIGAEATPEQVKHFLETWGFYPTLTVDKKITCFEHGPITWKLGHYQVHKNPRFHFHALKCQVDPQLNLPAAQAFELIEQSITTLPIVPIQRTPRSSLQILLDQQEKAFYSSSQLSLFPMRKDSRRVGKGNRRSVKTFRLLFAQKKTK